MRRNVCGIHLAIKGKKEQKDLKNPTLIFIIEKFTLYLIVTFCLNLHFRQIRYAKNFFAPGKQCYNKKDHNLFPVKDTVTLKFTFFLKKKFFQKYIVFVIYYICILKKKKKILYKSCRKRIQNVRITKFI